MRGMCPGPEFRNRKMQDRTKEEWRGELRMQGLGIRGG